MITGADGIKPGVGSETNFRRTLFAPFYIRSSAGARLRRLAREFMRHTPPSRNSSPRSGFYLSLATRLSEFLTRGFASQSHGWFALIEEFQKKWQLQPVKQQRRCHCAPTLLIGMFWLRFLTKKGHHQSPGPKRINER